MRKRDKLKQKHHDKASIEKDFFVGCKDLLDSVKDCEKTKSRYLKLITKRIQGR